MGHKDAHLHCLTDMPCMAIIESVTGVGNTVSHDWGNHIVRSLYEADTQPLKSVLVITGEARKWAVQIGTCIKLRSNFTYSDTSKCISNGNMVLTLREEPITTM